MLLNVSVEDLFRSQLDVRMDSLGDGRMSCKFKVHPLFSGTNQPVLPPLVLQAYSAVTLNISTVRQDDGFTLSLYAALDDIHMPYPSPSSQNGSMCVSEQIVPEFPPDSSAILSNVQGRLSPPMYMPGAMLDMFGAVTNLKPIDILSSSSNPSPNMSVIPAFPPGLEDFCLSLPGFSHDIRLSLAQQQGDTHCGQDQEFNVTGTSTPAFSNGSCTPALSSTSSSEFDDFSRDNIPHPDPSESSAQPVSESPSSETCYPAASHMSIFDRDAPDGDIVKGREAQYPCLNPSCDRMFMSMYTRQVHMKTHNTKPRKLHKCTMGCSESFTRQHDRQRHEVMLHGKKCDYVCERCSRFFSSQKMLDRHTCRSRRQGAIRWPLADNDCQPQPHSQLSP